MLMRTDGTRPWSSRVDRGQLLAPHVRSDGVLLVEGFAVREGVLDYVAPDGKPFRELVPLETIAASAGGLGRLPLTLQHPDGNVTPENAGELVVGDVDGEVVVEDGGFVRVKLAVRRGDALKAVQAGTQELSPGYEVQVDPTPGTHPVYGAYDGIQVARRYNHLALVDQARGGPEIRIRADGVSRTVIRADAVEPSGGKSSVHIGSQTPNTPAGKASGGSVNNRFIAVLSMLGVTRRIDSDDTAIDAIEAALRARKDAEEVAAEQAAEAETEAETEKSKMQAAMDALQAAFDALKTECDALKADRDAGQDKADRAALEPLAASLKVDASKCVTRKELRKAIATAHLGGKLRADATEAYIDAVVDLAQAASAARGDGRKAGSEAWAPLANDQGNQGANRQDGPPLTANQKAAERQAARAGGAK